MIRINLLPVEYRRSTRTSPKVFAAVLLSVMVVCGMCGWFGSIYFGDLSVLEDKRESEEERLAARKEQVAYHDALVTEKSDYQERAQTIDSIASSRVVWTEVLDQLIDTVNNDGDVDRHMAWFRSITVRDGSGSSGPSVAMPGWVQGADIDRLADFHDDLEETPFFRWVAQKSLPSGDLNVDRAKTPPESMYFSLRWDFKPTSKWDMDR